ncbi:hypothetical protein MMC26_006044 [Xylographa opegraphella]|nr:hypothetical protein [Xylographa opegraphella]
MEAGIEEDTLIHDSPPISEDAPDGTRLASNEGPFTAQNSNAEAIKLQNNLKARKRTKTGCLTCRKRRIKCGEERPTCANCIKSKRSCEGYAPRLTFKDPLGAFRPGVNIKGHGAHYQSFSSPNGAAGHYARPSSTPGAQGQLPVIAPRPLPHEHAHEDYLANNASLSPWSAGTQTSTRDGLPTPIEPSQDLPPRMRPMYERQFNHQGTSSRGAQATETIGTPNNSAAIFLPTNHSTTRNAVHGSDHPESRNMPPAPEWERSRNTTGILDDFQLPPTPARFHSAGISNDFQLPSTPAGFHSAGISNDFQLPPVPTALQTPTSAATQGLYPQIQEPQENRDAREYNGFGDGRCAPLQTPTSAVTQSHYSQTPNSQDNRDARVYNEYEAGSSFDQPAQPTFQKLASQQTQNYVPIDQSVSDFGNYNWSVNNGAQTHIPSHYAQYTQTPSTPSFHTKSPVREEPGQQPTQPTQPMQYSNTSTDPDDDLFDVETDDEEVALINRMASTPQNDVALLLALAASQDDRVLRSYSAFLNGPDVLASYLPTFTTSPLMDSNTARVFCHFITATGPSLSIFERHPTNPEVMFMGIPVPPSLQSLWTYTLPMKALSNQALLHAMLALASLHISSLQRTPPTASLRHYHFALRRLTKALSIPSRRADIATIAATLILGHYEATSAEHTKWNRHLAGARQLFVEIDFKSMTKYIKRKVAMLQIYERVVNWEPPAGNPTDSEYIRSFEQSSPEDSVDESIIRKLSGRRYCYEEYCRDTDDSVECQTPPITEKDIENHRTLSDLFWWFAKQDVYQSVISGNRLLLPYDRWLDCPPRGPIGELEAIYGTMDHVVLLMGRIADFASRDQLRKRKAMEANGGQWRPSPGMVPNSPIPVQRPGEPSSHSSPTRPAVPPPSQPPMYGMIPHIPPPQTPDRFTQAPRDQIYIPHNNDDDIELEGAAIAAMREWREIQEALDVFEKCLGPDWQALPCSLAPPFETPFGMSLHYRTWSISCIWALFYTGRIIAARAHPSMPPAAMMAAGVAAPLTAQWANQIGRIFCSLRFPPPDQPMNPALGAALMESTLSVFFAGVQYTDPVQRSIIISRLVAVAQMTGQQSSALIAAGIEQCWKLGGDAGRGPPYTPVVAKRDKNSHDHRMSGNPAPSGEELDRQMVYAHSGTRVHYAMGIMSMEEDFKDLRIVKHVG